jgi:hypothetical protein
MVQQTARTNGGADDEELNIAKTAAFLSAASEEMWVRMPYCDEEEDRAFELYKGELFLEEKERGKRLKAGLGREEWWDGIGSVVFDAPVKSKKSVTGKAQGKKKAATDVVMIDD